MKRILFTVMILAGALAFGDQTFSDFGAYTDNSVVIWESKANLYRNNIKDDKNNKTFVQFRNELASLHHQLKLNENRFSYLSKNKGSQKELQNELDTYNSLMDKLKDFQKRYNSWLASID